MAVQIGIPNFPPPGFPFPGTVGIPPPNLTFQATPVTNVPEHSLTQLPPPSVGIPQQRHVAGATGAASAALPGLSHYDGRRMRGRAVAARKTVDYNMTLLTSIQNRIWQRDERDLKALQPDALYQHMMLAPSFMLSNPVNCVMTRSVRTALNKVKCPIFATCWTPEGRRLITGASSGEFTLWNGLTFSFETILQAHDVAVRVMTWSNNDTWMASGDHGGFVKYWQSNMNVVKSFQAHKDPVRGISFSPTDQKFVTGADDTTVRIWDFARCYEEKIMRGHGADVKCVGWHPTKGLIASGSRDTQQPLKLWDPRTGSSLATIHAHKHTVMDLKWNRNGNWLLTASRDHLLKLFDIRNMKEEVQSYRGHKKEATTIAWHPIHETLFASGGSDGSLMYWVTDYDKEIGGVEEAHDTMIWSLAWHPLGHILVTGSNDHTTKFWTRNHLGDTMRDRYNLNTAPADTDDTVQEGDADHVTHMPLPGLDIDPEDLKNADQAESSIPGFDLTPEKSDASKNAMGALAKRKTIYTKPVPKELERAWFENFGPEPPMNQPRGMRPPKDHFDEFGPRFGGPDMMNRMHGPGGPQFRPPHHDGPDGMIEYGPYGEMRRPDGPPRPNGPRFDGPGRPEFDNRHVDQRGEFYPPGPMGPQDHGMMDRNGPPGSQHDPNYGPSGNNHYPRDSRVPGPDYQGGPNYQRPEGPGYQGPEGPGYRGPEGPGYQGPEGPGYQGPEGPEYQGPDQYRRPDGPQFHNPQGPQFPGQAGPRFQHPGGEGPRYQGPDGPRYPGPDGPNYPGADGQRYPGPDQRYQGPEGQRYQGPEGPRYPGPDGSTYSQPGDQPYPGDSRYPDGYQHPDPGYSGPDGARRAGPEVDQYHGPQGPTYQGQGDPSRPQASARPAKTLLATPDLPQGPPDGGAPHDGGPARSLLRPPPPRDSVPEPQRGGQYPWRDEWGPQGPDQGGYPGQGGPDPQNYQGEWNERGSWGPEEGRNDGPAWDSSRGRGRGRGRGGNFPGDFREGRSDFDNSRTMGHGVDSPRYESNEFNPAGSELGQHGYPEASAQGAANRGGFMGDRGRGGPRGGGRGSSRGGNVKGLMEGNYSPVTGAKRSWDESNEGPPNRQSELEPGYNEPDVMGSNLGRGKGGQRGRGRKGNRGGGGRGRGH